MKLTTNGHVAEVPQYAGDVAVPAYFRRKCWPTRLIGAAMLVIASPVILLLVIVVRLSSKGPGLYRQERSGRNGVPFLMYKVRTMYVNAESVSGPVWCKPGDSRITPLGKLLRLLHLDELPQLINVARGEMDLIGPRPERPVFVAKLAKEIPGYMNRLQVLPGVTGLAQINLPPDETLECVKKKLVLDCAYVNDASLFLDVRILACTCLRMFGIRHGHAAKWMGVQRHVHLAPAAEAEPRPAMKAPRWTAPRPAAAVVQQSTYDTAVGFDTAVMDADVQQSDTELAPVSVLAFSIPRPR